MISKLRFSLIAVIMLVLLSFGFQDQAKGQIGLNGLFCPAVPDTTGWLEAEIVGSGSVTPDFTAGLIGTVENSGVAVVGGLDWQHVDHTEFMFTPTPTNEVGSQLISWWTQKDGRNTYLQVTNANAGAVTVHVRFHNEDCVEIRDFCDTYTANDTHEYNLGDLVTNGGQLFTIPPDNEGFVTITPVDDCGSNDEDAVAHNHLSGQLVVHDSTDYLYGVNMYARWGICEDFSTFEEVNLIGNGSFQDGNQADPLVVPIWDETQGNAFSLAPDSQVIVPFPPVPAQLPDADSPNANLFTGYVVSSNRADFTSGTYDGGTFSELSETELINNGVDINVSVLQSNQFTVGFLTEDAVTFDFSFLAGIGDTCVSYGAVLLIDTTGNAGAAAIVDAICVNQPGTGQIDFTLGGNELCTLAVLTDPTPPVTVLGTFDHANGRTSTSALSFTDLDDGTYVIQIVTGQSTAGTCGSDFDADTGVIADNFRIILEEEMNMDCVDGVTRLDGRDNAMLDNIHPETLAAQFNILPANVSAGADVVLINFADDYGPPYRPIAAFSNISVSIFDEHEVDQSCGEELVCFTRLGIDDALVLSENFAPTAPPTVTPPPTSPPTDNPSFGSSSCAIAGNPVQLGTALANVLIPLVPVAFAFGVRAVRRRKK
jgi:hypothetical protein